MLRVSNWPPLLVFLPHLFVTLLVGNCKCITESTNFTPPVPNAQTEPPIVKEPRQIIRGRAGIIKHHILNNRRHILTKDTAGRIILWDITKGLPIKDFGDKVTLEEKVFLD